MTKILVVDDDESMLASMERQLKLKGYEVITAPNGKVALSKCDQLLPDVIITDMLMPEMDGIEFIVEIKKRHSEIPIISLSGGGRFLTSAGALENASMFGADVVLEKPVPIDKLLNAIADLVSA